MKKTVVGLIAGVASMGLGATAFANDRANASGNSFGAKHDTTTTMKSSDMTDHMAGT